MGTDGSTLEVTGYTVNDGNSGADYTVTTDDAAGTITPAALTITATSESRVYNGTTTSTAVPTTSALFGDDTVTGLTQAFSSKNVLGVEGSTLVVTGYTVNDVADYTVTTASAPGTITPAALTITATSDSHVYNGTTTSTAVPTTSALFGDDTVTGLSQAFSSKNVLGPDGSTLEVTGYTVNDGNGGSNYTVTTVDAAGTITPAPLTITADGTSKTYGDTVTFDGTEFTESGLLNGDAVTSVTLTSPGALATAPVAGTPYAITPSAAVGTGLDNYTITYDPGYLTVNRASLTITGDSTSKTYGDTVTFDGTEFTDSGLHNSDTVTSVTLTSPGADSTATVAGSPYAIIPSAAVGTGLSNYTIAYVNGSLTVTPAVLTVGITAANKVYDGTTSATLTSETLNGVVGSDQVSLSGGTATFADKNVGNLKTVTDTGLSLTGADASNYVLSPALVTTSANITPAPLTILANNQPEPFGGPVPPLTASYVGFVGGDTPASLTTPVQLVTTATSNSPAGAYPIVPAGAVASNYAISYVDGTMNVSSFIPLPSAKGRAADSFIATLYQQVLGRGPEPSGLQYWVGKRLKGMPQKQIWRQFVKSVERHALEAAGLAPSIPVGVAYSDAVRADQSAQTSGHVSVRIAPGHINPKPAAVVSHHGGKR